MKSISELLQIYSNKKPNRLKDSFPEEFEHIVNITNFLPENSSMTRRLWHLKMDMNHIPICEICQSNPKLWIDKKKDYSVSCSVLCSNRSDDKKKKIKSSLIINHGVDVPIRSNKIRQKIKECHIRKYGVDNYAKTDEFIKKVQNTNKNKYGTEWQITREHVKKSRNRHFVDNKEKILTKRKNTCLKKYGYEYPVFSDLVKDKIKNTCLKRYNRPSSKQKHFSDQDWQKLINDEYLKTEHLLNNKTLSEIATELSMSLSTISRQFDNLNIEKLNFYSSVQERQLAQFLINVGINIELRNRSLISPFELDIVIPSQKIAIEFCGLYWHNELNKKPNYHKCKLDACNKIGYRLITIFEDEWNNNNELVKIKLLNILKKDNSRKIYGRKCHVNIVENKEKINFLNENHIQGAGPGSITYGLTYQNELVAIMTFIKKSTDMYELNRYATKGIVSGGFTKLLNHFKNNHVWKIITSFADLRWSNGDVYCNTGWILDKKIKPDYEYVINGKRYHKFGFRHRSLIKKLKNYDPTLSEHQNCLNNNIFRIYDCGKLKFVLKNS